MKLLFCLFNYFPFGGLQKSCLTIAHICASKGHEVCILTGEWQGQKPHGIRVIELKIHALSNAKKVNKYIRNAQHYFSAHDFDLIIGFNRIPGIDVYYGSDPCYKTIYDALPWYKKIMPRHRNYLRIEQQLCADPNVHFFFLTPRERNNFTNHYHLDDAHMHNVLPGVNALQYPLNDYNVEYQHQLKAAQDILPSDKLILFIGSRFKTKGLTRALKAIASLPQAMQDTLYFWIVGDDDPKPYLGLIKKLNLQLRIRFLGARDDVPELLKTADLLLHPALVESGGNVLLEAMASALPILTTDICGYTPYVLQAKAGYAVSSPFQQENLNQLLLQMLSTDLTPMRVNGLRYCINHTNPQFRELVAEEIIKIGYAFPATVKMNILDWLNRKKTNLTKVQYHFSLADGSDVSLSEMLRLLPNKRWVVQGTWHDKKVVVKLFVSERKYYAELAGIARCKAAGILIPHLLYKGVLEKEGLYFLMFEYIEKDPLDHGDAVEDLVKATALHHKAGLMQSDMHVNNFIKNNQQIIALDNISMVPVKNPMQNVAVLLAQFGLLTREHITHYFKLYHQTLDLEFVENKVNVLIKKIDQYKKKLLKIKIKKVFRNSSMVLFLKESNSKFIIRTDAYTVELYVLLHQLDKHFTDRKKNRIIQLEMDKHHYVVEQYHAFNLGETPASKRWKNSYLSEFKGEKDIQPVALVESFGLLKKTSYFIGRYSQ